MPLPSSKVYRDRFSALRRAVYLDSASFGIPSDRVVSAQVEYLRLAAEIPPTSLEGLAYWEKGQTTESIDQKTQGPLNDWKGVEELRKKCAELLNCEANNLWWCENTTNAFETLLSRIKWKPEDEIIVTDLEHDSIANICELMASIHGVRLCLVQARELVGHIDFNVRLQDRIVAQMNSHTRMVVFSHIFYSCGLQSDPTSIVDAVKTKPTRESETIVVIDGAHALGHIPIRISNYGCDAYVTSGSKWLLAPPGTGILYVSSWHPELMWPSDVYDAIASDEWKTRTRQLRFSSQPPEDYVLGVTPQVPLVGLRSAVADYTEIGSESAYSMIDRNAKEAREMLNTLSGFQVHTSINGGTGMVFLSRRGWTYQTIANVVRQLKERQVFVAAIRNPPSIRISTHYFNTTEDIDAFASELSKIART